MKSFLAKWLLPLVFGAILVVSVGSMAFVAANTYNTHSIAQSTHQIVQQHNYDIKNTQALAKRILTLQAEHQDDLNTIQADATSISKYALQLSKEISANHDAAIKNQQYICSTIPGCDPTKILASGGS